MKKTLVMILAASMALGTAALGETAGAAEGLDIQCRIENGSYVIRIPVEDDDLGWKADDMEQDDSVVVLGSETMEDGTYEVRYDPVSDGDMTVAIHHYYNSIASDRSLTWDLHVEDGAVTESAGGSNAMTDPWEDQSSLDPFLSGEWAEAETQFSRMTVSKAAYLGWDIEIVTPATHGAYIFKTTAYSDADGRLVYNKGKYWDVPITDSEEKTSLGEAKTAGTMGSFTFDGDEDNLKLVWNDTQRPEETVIFERIATENGDPADTSDWEYTTFEGSDVEMKLPADFEEVGEPSVPVIYTGRNNDVLLQVQIMPEKFADRDELMEYMNNLDYIVRATQIEINDAELVYARGSDEDARIYAAIGPEGYAFEFVFIPQNENAEAVIQAITQTICHSGR